VPKQQRAEPAVVAAIDHPIAAVKQSGKGQPPGRHLKHLVAPALRLLDRWTALGIGPKQGRVRLQPVEEASDVAIGLHALAAVVERRHGPEAIRHGQHQRTSITNSPMDGIAREASQSQEHRMKAGGQGHGPVGDALVIEHQHPRAAGVGAEDHVQLRGGGLRHVLAPSSAATGADSGLRWRRKISSTQR
jgi:hypothetical protein